MDRRADSVGRQGFERWDRTRGETWVLDVTPALRIAFLADNVGLGGGHGELVHPVPPGIRCGGNEDAIDGRARLRRATVEPHGVLPSPRGRVVA